MKFAHLVLLFACISCSSPSGFCSGAYYYQPAIITSADSLNMAQASADEESALRQIDTFAMNAPSDIDKTPATVAAYLLKGCKNDMQKARAAFAWVANNIRYDDNAFNSGKIGDMSAPAVLRRKHAVCEGYANLYQAIGQAMGLEVEVIHGYAKAYGYHEGQRFTGTEPNHAWNAVKINGEWVLLDVTWGAGHAEGGRGQLRSRKEFTPYWFNVNKYEFLFVHYPQEEKWLLVPQPFTLRQYEEMPRIEPPFFQLGFDAHQIMDQSIAKTLPKQLPEVMLNKHHVKLLDFPLSGTLAATGAASFSLICEEDVDIEFINPDPKDGVHMEKNGNKYSITMPLKRGDLQVGIRPKTSNAYTGIIKYRVK